MSSRFRTRGYRRTSPATRGAALHDDAGGRPDGAPGPAARTPDDDRANRLWDRLQALLAAARKP